MATDAGAELRVDVHNIEPIPEADKDSTGLQQMWIWAGASIAPINCALGALGVVLKLGLWEAIAVVVLVIQVLIGLYGFYAIRTFEKYTVPVTAAIMVLMSILAWTRSGVVDWGLTSTLPPAAHLAMITLLMTAIGVGWGISWVTWASDYSRFVPRTVSSTAVFWYSYVGMFVPTVWLAILGATVASVTLDTDPAKMVSAVFGGVTSILVLLMVLHGPIA